MNVQRIESLKLYRDILRACRAFTWRNSEGNIWGQVLKDNARKEFEINRHQKDSLLIAQLIFTSRDALNQINDKMLKAKHDFENKIDSTRTDKR